MAQEVIVTSRDFDGITNPYTGEPMVVKMVVGCGPEPLFHAPDTYSPNDVQSTTKLLYELWSRVDGRQGLRTGQPKCAYTGKPLTVTEFAGGYHFTGGFDPRMLLPRGEFLYYATMRDGRATMPEPNPIERVTKPKDETKPSEAQISHAESVTPGVSQESIELAEKQIEKHRDELPLPTKTGYTGRGKRR